jgi:7-cyano-7-deazaguanine synthase
MNKALVLFSGGIDSTTALYWAQERFTRTNAVTFDYGQRHVIEIQLAVKLAERLGVPQKILSVDLSQIGGSALTDTNESLPTFQGVEEIGDDTPPTYVPFRNGIFLSLATAWAEVIEARNIVCGFNIIDSPNYPDTRSVFVRAMENAINLGTKAALQEEHFVVHTPFGQKRKSDIIRLGLELGADFSYSISCYAGDEIPCLRCSSCLLRQRAWQEVGAEDHLIVRLKKEGRI